MDPISIVMFGLIAVLIFFMFRNGKKRQAAAAQMQNDMRPGAEVMLSSGIYATIDSIDEENNRVTVTSGTTTLVVHRQAVSQIVTPTEAAPAESAEGELAPDDDPAFGERIENSEAAQPENDDSTSGNDDSADQAK